MTLGELLDMLHISNMLGDVRVVILESNLATSSEKVYDQVGINDDYISRRMMKGLVESIEVTKEEFIISIHTDI